MRKMLNIITMIMLMAFASVSAESADEAARNSIIRVSILNDRDSFNLTLKGNYKIYALHSERVLMEGPYICANVTALKDGIRIEKKEIKLSGIRVKVSRDANIYVDSKRFRGDIDIIRRDNGKLTVVNYIPIDDYLYGVLYHEVSHRWPTEVLKAQAIAARTFALYQVGQNKLQPYDLRNDIYSQVYGGRSSEKWATTRAVNLTKGDVLTYKGSLIPAYYHATCAGATEDASNLWNIDVPYLKGVKCDYCKGSKHYQWTKEMPLSELSNKLIAAGYKIGNISGVTILSRNASGRVDKMEIKDEVGVTLVMTGKDFRQALGPNEVRSTRFDASIKRNTLVMTGTGWGHGVGMCQWGAYGMARKGFKAEDILRYYYPGTEISNIKDLNKKP
jgi:stage II sporulation protein D